MYGRYNFGTLLQSDKITLAVNSNLVSVENKSLKN